MCIRDRSSSGKTLTIEFVNQRHYRAQQCFMSVQLVDNADSSTMLDKRYFVTNDNQLTIQNDLMNSLSDALAQPWPARMQAMLRQYQPSQSVAAVKNKLEKHNKLIYFIFLNPISPTKDPHP